MRIKCFSIHLFLLLPMYLLSQKNIAGYVIYESGVRGIKRSNYITDKRKNIKDKNLVKTLDDFFFNTKKIKSKLVFSNNEGFFKVIDELSIKDNDVAQKVNRILAGDTKEYYFNNKSKLYLIKECEILGECFIFENRSLDWRLTQETKLINGYKVFKAMRSNNLVVAWYTPSIPVGFGPKGEYGLPGLVLELEIGNIVFNAKKIVLNPKESIKIKEPKNGKRISTEEYGKMVKKVNKNVFGN